MNLNLRAIILAAVVILTVGFSAQLQATVISVPDALDQTGSYTIPNSITGITGEDSVYIAGTMTFDSVDTSIAYDVVEISPVGGYDYQWGHRWDGAVFGFLYPDPDAEIDTDLAAAESFLTVLKIDQTTGDYSFFADPDLSMLEGDNTPLFSRTGGVTGTIDGVQFRGGNAGNDSGQVDYTGFAVYTGSDTPFALPPSTEAIPEPSTFVIWALGLIGLIGWRRRS